MDTNSKFEITGNTFVVRALQTLEDPLYCEKLLFFQSQSLSKMNELDTPAESILKRNIISLIDKLNR